MIMNSLCALALGFVLDMMLSDLPGKYYPTTLVKKLVGSLEVTLKKAYADSPDAQNMAGIMLVVMTLLICAGSSAALLFIFYKINVILGIIFEGVLCWCSISVKYIRRNMLGVFRGAKAGDLPTVKKYLKNLTNRDIEDLDMEASVKCAVEAASENTVDWIIGPVFWAVLFGGMGAMICRCINIMDNTVGYKDKDHLFFGRVPARLDDVLMFIPARLAALFMRLDSAFLKLDSKGAASVYKRDKRKSPSPNSGCTQAVCAGALNIRLGSDEYYGGELVRKPVIGDGGRDIDETDVFWTNQLVIGTAAYGMMFAAVIKILANLLISKL